MAKAYRVAIADADPDTLACLSCTLRNLGHYVSSCAPTIKQLRVLACESEIDLIIGEVNSEGCLEAIGKWSDTRRIPAILTSYDGDWESLAHNLVPEVLGIVIKPIREAALAAMILVATQRYHESEQLRRDASSLRKALDDRKIIEQAKGIVMKKCGLDEAGAFKHLQHLSRQHRQQLIDIAQGLLIAESAYTLNGNALEIIS